jgi:hypothetical protein
MATPMTPRKSPAMEAPKARKFKKNVEGIRLNTIRKGNTAPVRTQRNPSTM